MSGMRNIRARLLFYFFGPATKWINWKNIVHNRFNFFISNWHHPAPSSTLFSEICQTKGAFVWNQSRLNYLEYRVIQRQRSNETISEKFQTEPKWFFPGSDGVDDFSSQTPFQLRQLKISSFKFFYTHKFGVTDRELRFEYCLSFRTRFSSKTTTKMIQLLLQMTMKLKT